MENKIEVINWLQSGIHRIQLLNSVLNRPIRPSELASLHNISRSSVTRILKDLKNQRLVECTKMAAKNKLYSITQLGMDILKELSRFEKG